MNANVKFAGCVCSENPSISVPLTIIPRGNPAVYGFAEPYGYAPQYFPMVGFILPLAAQGAMAQTHNEVEITTVQHTQIAPMDIHIDQAPVVVDIGHVGEAD